MGIAVIAHLNPPQELIIFYAVVISYKDSHILIICHKFSFGHELNVA